MNIIKKIFPYIVILVLLVIIKNNISSTLDTLSSVNTTEKLQKQLEIEKKENSYLQERLKYVKTNQFVEEEAKEKLGLLKSGEFFVIAPTATPLNTKPVISVDYPNWRKWLELFF